LKSNPQDLPPYCSIQELPPWGLKEVIFAFFLAFIAVSLLTSYLLSTLFSGISEFAKLILAHLASYMVWIIILVTLAKRYGTVAFTYLGLKKEKSYFSYIYDGFCCGGLILLIGWGMGFLVQQFNLHYKQPFEAFPAQEIRIIAFLAIFTAPFLEEIAFRGFLQPALYRYMKIGPAIFLTAMLFTFFHTLYYGNIMAMIYVVLMGLVLGYFRHVTKSTIPCIIGHLLNNMMAALVI
jgi:membrane protease YdiL (CAAX protease family)